MTFGVGPDAIIGDDEGFTIESSFERRHGSPLKKPPKEAFRDRKPTRKDRVKQAADAEAIISQVVTLLPSDLFENDGKESQETANIPLNVVEVLIDRYMDDLHSMALSETESPTLL